MPEDERALAIVGCRSATNYGVSAADRFGFQLAQVGFTVVSGLARGIDSAAHRGALKAKGRTIAVLGSALDCLYPSENAQLAEEIAASGAVIAKCVWEKGGLSNFAVSKSDYCGTFSGNFGCRVRRKKRDVIHNNGGDGAG